MLFTDPTSRIILYRKVFGYSYYKNTHVSWIFERIWRAENLMGMFGNTFQITLLFLLTLNALHKGNLRDKF